MKQTLLTQYHQSYNETQHQSMTHPHGKVQNTETTDNIETTNINNNSPMTEEKIQHHQTQTTQLTMTSKEGLQTTNHLQQPWGDTLAPKPQGHNQLVLQNIGGIDMTLAGLIKLAAL